MATKMEKSDQHRKGDNKMNIMLITSIAFALFMREISLKARLETFIIAPFVIAGVKVASIISSSLQ